MSTMKKKVVLTAGMAIIAAGAASGVALATGDDGDQTVTGPDADAATEAGLAATGGGRANSVEMDSENGATWEVEITKPDGATVDVRLDERLKVVVIEGDHEDPDE